MQQKVFSGLTSKITTKEVTIEEMHSISNKYILAKDMQALTHKEREQFITFVRFIGREVSKLTEMSIKNGMDHNYYITDVHMYTCVPVARKHAITLEELRKYASLF